VDTPPLTPTEAAELLAVRPTWIYEAVRAGALPCLRIGRSACREERAAELAARTLALPDAQSVDLTALLTSARER
jgi:excisionase family DNA binding protein